ncbi:MAG: head maturation protease, ClpP-related [Planctomycetota bacterium]|jgi:ATP-dependent Clp endopeptidase proteolytic subunit ClpP
MKIIPISGEIGWDVWPSMIRRQIEEANGDDIEFQISSPGGYIYDGLEIFNLIRACKGKTTTIATGMAASMASYLLMAGDVKKATPNAIFMVHNARAFSGGDQNKHRKLANVLEGMSNLLGREYIKQTGKTKEEVHSLMDDETYFFGEEIKEAGFVDEIIEVEGMEIVAKDEAISNTSAKVAAVIEKIRSKPEDISKIAAILKPKDKSKNIVPKTAPKTADDSATRHSATNLNQKKVIKMTLDEYLASDATGKSEYEKRLGEAKAKGVKQKEDEIARIHPLITAEGASKALIDSGFKALKGEQSVDSFVAIADYETRIKEEAKAEATKEDQKPDTDPASKATNTNKPKNADDMKGLAAELKTKVL